MSLLIVLGMHRSGTSSLTGVLSLMGYSAGNQLFTDQFNERGYFEDITLNQKLDNFLIEIDRTWHDERAYPSDWLTSDAVASASNELRDFFEKEFNFNKPTVIKNPRICRLLPLLQPIWSDIGLSPNYILTLRSPFAVIDSLARRNKILPQRAAMLYVAYLLEAEMYTRNQPRVLVEYDQLLLDWRKVLIQIESKLGIDIISSIQSETVCLASVDAFITNDLNHFSDKQSPPTGVAIDLATNVYDLMRASINNSQTSDLDTVRLYWKEYLNSLEPWVSEAVSFDKLKNEVVRCSYKSLKDLALLSSSYAMSEMFWACSDEVFSETRKVSIRWNHQQKMIQRFVFPELDKPIEVLRWDITDRPAICIIEKVWLEDSNGQVRWHAQQNMDCLFNSSADMKVVGYTEAGNLHVTVTGEDPSAILNIPRTILNLVQTGWSFCVNWNAEYPEA